MQILAVGFLGVILGGGVLLWLPVSNQQPIAFVDALFTSVTAVCVTGLVTITPVTQFTLFGKIVLLLLIQIGGLGVIACVMAFFLIIKKRISVKERILIQETYSADSLGGMVAMIIRVLKGTFLVEGAGAVLYAFQFVPEYGFLRGVWYSVFHAVSAFCNAGIDILGDSSFIKYVDNPVINVTTMLLIVLSGLGFPVWYDILQNLRKGCFFRKFRLHTKIVLLMTTVLVAAGTLVFLELEYRNPETLGNLSFGEKVMAAMFQSVTTRTAGFATLPQASLTQGTMFTGCMLMFIGGSPGGTAGGVKTTTVFMLILCCVSVIRGDKDMECFRRRIPAENIRTGICIVIVAFGTLLLGTTLVTVLEGDVSFMRVLYETTSAIGTVGLTADLTPSLCLASKIVIMMMMYIGRIGPVTFALVFGARREHKDSVRRLPSQEILVG